MERITCYGTSRWTKNIAGKPYPLTLRVETEKEGGNRGACKATFFGDNPFPCFSMQTTYHVLEAWLKENGWKRYGETKTTKVKDTINPDTGEVLCHWSETIIIKKGMTS